MTRVKTTLKHWRDKLALVFGFIRDPVMRNTMKEQFDQMQSDGINP